MTRRDFVKVAGATGATLAVGQGGLQPAAAAAMPGRGAAGPRNILFILTDQERYFDPAELPAGYTLQGRERLRREGVTFANHQIGSAVCTSSRSVIYTGQHMQKTGMFDNLGFPWSKSLPKEIPTVGHMLQAAGYHAGYLGKWHMSEELEEVEVGNIPEPDLALLNEVMRGHGFEDYIGVGDIIGMTLGGYRTDEFTTSTAIRWLRGETPGLQQEGQPWFLAVNLVNPHDVMFFDTDVPGEDVQKATKPLFELNREPAHALYQRRWNARLPASRKEPWDNPGRPRAHYEFQNARQLLVGRFPGEDARWQRLLDYYLNCIADCDTHVVRLLDELDALGLAEDTIVVMTSDHGELAGAHGMHGKGANGYHEQNHVPLWIRHPDHADSAGQECAAITSHLDLAPTLLSLTGAEAKQRASIAPQLKGKDLTPLLAQPRTASVDAVRDGALFNYNMWLYQDSEFMRKVGEALRAGKDVGEQGLKPDLKKRGAIRSVNDGRYRFTRYFSPLQHNLPRSLEELLEYNDLELFDLSADPDESNNLAADPEAPGDLLLAMNEKLTGLIEDEVGRDEGQFLPENKAGWNVTTIDP
jgi:arylsulfatase